MELIDLINFKHYVVLIYVYSFTAIWTSRVISHTTLTLQAVNSASQLDKTQNKGDFLRSGLTDTVTSGKVASH